MNTQFSCARTFSLLAGLLLLSAAAHASQIDIVGPAGSGKFGWTQFLPNGNFVVVDPEYSRPAGAAKIGAVYLYSPARVLISTLTGSSANDRVGNAGVYVVGDTNFVVASSYWNNGQATEAGAATWVNGKTGLAGVVSKQNSLVGTFTGDRVGGFGVKVLPNGNYVVANPNWSSNRGAVTWALGNKGVTGDITKTNSLVGSTAGDTIGNQGFVTILSNGNYVVYSPNWTNSGKLSAGAVTWCDGSQATTGEVSASNSLVGTTERDRASGNGVTALSNGNYVVTSSEWDSGDIVDAGAVTWCNGKGGTVGPVSGENSLVGSSPQDQVGRHGAFALSNGDYVVCSGLWDNSGTTDAGAATWCSGASGFTGTITPDNSLVGKSVNDNAGIGGVTELANGNYVIVSYNWKNGTSSEFGAVTWVFGGSGIFGDITPENSLVGGTQGDKVGFGGVTALTNGHFVVSSFFWGTDAVPSAGAATWCDGTIGRTGAVTSDNSLVGSTGGDSVSSDSVVALSNGNYVVRSGKWKNGAAVGAGAATWGDGNKGVTGVVSEANSLVGTSTDDQVGRYEILALKNGHYVVCSPYWSNGGTTFVGAATWCNGEKGLTGTVSKSNSLIGSTTNDHVGAGGATELNDGNYVVHSFNWSNAGAANAGAVTWGNGSSGTVGVVGKDNSLVGSVANDQVGADPNPVVPFNDGNYFVRTRHWHNGAAADAGAATWCDAGGVTVGTIVPENSVRCVTASGGDSMSAQYNSGQGALFVSRVFDNILSIFVPGGINHPPALTPAGPFTLAENSANGTNVGTIAATDPDNDPLAFSITAGNSSGAFAIGSASGALTVLDSTKLDFESVPQHKFTLTISVSDGEVSATAAITINLSDVNETPSISPAGPFTLAENSESGTAVGTVSATDPDAGAALSFSISAGDSNGAFILDSTSGAITVADSSRLDYETVPNHKFVLTVTVSDGTLSASTTVTVNLTDENDPPAVEAAVSFTLAENSANGTVVGTISASDPEGSALAFSITGGNSSGAFAIDAVSGEITVANTSALNFETVPGHKFEINVTVSDGISDGFVLVTINLSDVNEAPAAVNGSLTVSGTTPKAGQLTASDPEGATLAYSIVGDATKGTVSLNSGTGAYTYTAGENIAGTDTFTFKVSDGTFDSNIATVNITITHSNAAPVLDSAPAALPDSAYVGTPISFSAAASDADGDALTFAWDFKDGNTASGASVQHTFSVAGIYVVEVTVSDGELAVAGTVQVTVLAPKPAPATKGAVKFNFAAANKDSFSLSGTMNFAAGYVIRGKHLDIVIVDYIKNGLVFDSKNTAAAGKTLVFKLTAKTDKNTGAMLDPLAKYALSIKNESLFEELKRAGFVNDNVKNKSVPVTATFKIDGVPYEARKTFVYSAKKSKSGTGK